MKSYGLEVAVFYTILGCFVVDFIVALIIAIKVWNKSDFARNLLFFSIGYAFYLISWLYFGTYSVIPVVLRSML